MSNDKKWQERFNFIIEDGVYVAKSVNFPIIIQADTMDELKLKSKSAMESMVEMIQKTLALQEPVEFKEVSQVEFMKT